MSLFLNLLWILLAAGVVCPRQAAAEPVPLIFDTDMGNDIDDALALAMIHSLQSRNECRLLGVTITKESPWAAVFVSLVNAFYGRDSIPVGLVRGGKTPEDGSYIRQVSERRNPSGQPAYPRRLRDGRHAPEAVTLLRRLLAGQADGSVVVVQVGFSTNLARLLDSGPDGLSPLNGRELVERKVRLLSVMAGQFPPGRAEYNVKTDREAAAKLFAEWPAPIVASGYEVGASILYPASSIEQHYLYAERHPIVDAYRAYKAMPYDRETWDLTSVLYAARPEEGYFGLSEPGVIRVDAEGRTHFTPSVEGRHRYLTISPVQRARVLEAFVHLASQPPGK